MLRSLRQQATHPFLLLLFAIIVVVFIFTFGSWGGNDVSGNMPVAAKVNGHVIPEAEFNVRYANAFRNQGLVRPGYDAEQAKREDLKGTILDQLIDQELLAQEAEDHGFVISDDEVVDFVKSRYFGSREFDREEYKRIVNGIYQTTEARFEARTRREILAQHMAAVLTDAVHVSPTELHEAFEDRYNRADLYAIRIDPLFYKKESTPTDDDVATWAEKNGEAISTYYNKHINRYKKPKQVKARHILVKAGPTASDAEKAAARKKVEDALARIKGGEDFAKVAQEVSEDGSAKNGGSLGFFGPGAMVKNFEKAAFALKPGELSDVVETKFGYHIIKVEETKEPSIKELDEVKTDIARQLLREERQMELARAAAKQALEELKAGTAPEKLSLPQLRVSATETDTAGLDPFAPRVDTTGWFARNARYVPRIGISSEVVEAAFKLSKDAPVADQIFEVSGRLYLIQLKDRETADEKKFAEEKGSIEQTLLGQRKNQAVESFLKEERQAAKIWRNPKVLSYAGI